MDADGQGHPDEDSWVIACHATEDDDEPLGAGVVIDERRVLTCAHVTEAAGDMWVAFPKAGEGSAGRRVRVARVVVPADRAKVQDLAVMYLSEQVPAGVIPAPLRCPKPRDLVSKWWCAFGFPNQDPIGSLAEGRIGAVLGYGWIRLDTGSRYLVEQGFSGGGLWSPDYQAVVAVVCQALGGKDNAHKGDGRAITLQQADEWFPGEKIRALTEQWSAAEAGEAALAAWNWSLVDDPEGIRHWRSIARGVSIDSDSGFWFRGRVQALRKIKDWLDRAQSDRRVLVVTGLPGAGKSAVLGRIVTTADADAAKQLPATDTEARATIGSVGCAVHARGKTALEVAAEIARAASAALPERIEDFVPAIRDALTGRQRRFNVIVDAVDEAVSPAEARAVIGQVLVPLAETCADVGAQVVAGSRRADSDGNVLDTFGGAASTVDLDDAEFFDEDDLAAYALAALQLTGSERAGNPYADNEIATPVAARIAELSEGNFLVAGLIARSHGLRDDTAVHPAAMSFSPKVDNAMREYLDRISPVAGTASGGGREVSAQELLTALAFAEAPGLPANLWRTALRALGVGDVPEAVLIRFAQSSAASFLVESGGDTQGAAFRLFHQALGDVLLRARAKLTEPVADEQALTLAFLSVGHSTHWERAPAYLLRSLPAHAARAGLVDKLLADDAYLLHADLRSVLRMIDHAHSPDARDRARLVGLTPGAVAVGHAERAAMFSVTEALNGLGTTFRQEPWPTPYRARWAAVRPSQENLILDTRRDEVRALCAVQAGNRTLLAVGSGGIVQLWDPADGTMVHALNVRQGRVWALCAVQLGNQALLAVGSTDGSVQVWDPANATRVHALDTRHDWVRALCPVQAGGRTLLAVGGGDGVVRLWDPGDATQVHTLDTRQDEVRALYAVETRSTTLLAVGGTDGTVQLWDPANAILTRTVDTRQTWVQALCAVESEGQTVLAAGGTEGTVQVKDPANSTQVHALRPRHDWVNGICAVQAGNRSLFAVGGGDGVIRLWDPGDTTQAHTLDTLQGQVHALCTVQAGDRTLLAVGGNDGRVRLWDLRTVPSDRGMYLGEDAVQVLCTVQAGGRSLFAVGGADTTVRLWDLAGVPQVLHLNIRQGEVKALSEVQIGGRTLLAVGDSNGIVRLWDPADGSQTHILDTGKRSVRALCTVQTGNRSLLAVGFGRGSVQMWDPADGSHVHTLDTGKRGVRALCVVQAGGRSLLAVGGGIGEMVQLWDPAEGKQIHTLDSRQSMPSMLCAVQATDRTLLAAGGDGGTVQLWDPTDGSEIRTFDIRQNWVDGMCAVHTGDRALLAIGGDGMVQLWDPTDGTHVLTVPVQHQVLALTSVADSLAVGLTAGLIVITLNPGFLA